MFRIFYANKDATLYEGATSTNALSVTNTGLDELLEVGKYLANDGNTLLKSRCIVQFDTQEIQSALQTYSADLNNCKFILQLFTTQAQNLPSDYTIDAKVVAQPWINGTGTLNSSPIVSNGVQWAKPYASWSLDNTSGSLWISSSQQLQVTGTSLYVSGSGAGGSWLWQSGSGFFNISNFNQVFFAQPGLDVNNGFILKFSDADESNTTITGRIKFYSRETHTIYVPKLTMYFDNTTFTTGSLTQADLESYVVYTQLKPQYKDTEIAKIRIYARAKYPQKSPTNLFPIETVNYLPDTTYYAVFDALTDEAIIPYDNIYNKVSCDGTSNFIYIDMNGFMPERYYRLELKIVDGFTEQYVNDQIYFKVVR